MIGVIPAGGRSTRFMGIHKEMLPISNGHFLFTAALERARIMGADRCVVISSAEKVAFHERMIGANDTLLVSSNKGLWAAIRETFVFRSDSLLILPDTFFTPKDAIPDCSLSFGVFSTNEPHRFSIMADETIVTKPLDMVAPQMAWGCVAWKADVIEYWHDRDYATYDQAFRDAMHLFPNTTFAIDGYHDLGNWESYHQFVTEQTS